MSPRAWRDRLLDILEAAEEILEFTEGMDLASFSEDAKTRKAVLADIAIIGEAAAHAAPELVREHAEIPWRSMRAMRNVVIHAYFQIEPGIVWQTIQEDIPDLVAKVRSALSTD